MMMYRISLIAVFLIVVAPLATGEDSAVLFVEKTSALELKLSGGAACWADFNNDGWVDVCCGGVWTNQNGKRFAKTADIPGACVAADFDNDGFVDLFSWSTLGLYRNQGGKSFTQVKLPELPPCVSRGACWGDFNGDGFVDLFVGGYEDWGKGITYPFLVLINENGKSFRLARSESRTRARGVTACDFDRDGDLDVYVSSYRLQPNLLWVNNGKEGLTEAAKEYGVVATSEGFGGGHSIGSVWGDFDNDGVMDLFAGNFAHSDGRGDQPKSRFLKNLGRDQKYRFKDMGTGGVYYQESYASPAAADFDNDGQLDLFFTTVYGTASFGKKNYPVLFRNTGGFKFVDVTENASLAKLGPTYQASWADYDNDGDLDLTTAGRFFENQGSGKNWIKIRLEGDGELVNRSAIGAQVRIKLGIGTLSRQVAAGTGEGNQNEPTMHFGLGAHQAAVDVEILWPNLQRQSVRGLQTRRMHVIKLKDRGKKTK